MSTEILRPNAAGDETSIPSQYPNSTEHWDKVDEESADDATTYVYTGLTSYTRDLYNLSNPTGSGTVNSITIYFRIRGYTAQTVYAKPVQKSGGTVTEGGEQSSYGLDWVTKNQVYTTNPATSLPYTFEELASLQVGVALKGSAGASHRCTQVYVEVDYTPAVTEKTSSDTGSGADALTSGNPVATLIKAETGAGLDVVAQAQAILEGAEVGSGADAYVSLVIFEARFSSDVGLGVEGTPMLSAILAGSETGAGIEALIARLLASFDTGYGVEVGSVEVGGLLEELFASELGQGIDALVVKREIFGGGEGTKFFGGGHKPPHRAS